MRAEGVPMKRREFLEGVAGVAAVVAAGGCASMSSQAASSAARPMPRFAYVGCYTSKDRNGTGEGISVHRIDPASGAFTQVQVLKEIVNPSWLTLDRQSRFLYSAHGDGTEVVAYAIDETTGRLTVMNRQPTRGRNGVHLAIDATGRFLAVANYASGSLVVLPINENGSLAPVSDLAETKGTPGPHRTQQESSHPHHCPFDRTGRFIVVPDKGLDKVFVYRLDTAKGKLVPGSPADVVSRSGAAPRHVDFHPAKPFAYVINELDSTIAVYQFEPERGTLKPLQIHTTLPSSYTGNNTSAEIAVAPSGRFVYGSNRGHDSIAIFSVDQATGLLTSIGWEPTQGQTPRYFGLDPSGDHLYAANQTSDTVVIFRVDKASGKLAPTGEVLKVGSPSAIAFR
jgi:6-phosphogluconolactonase